MRNMDKNSPLLLEKTNKDEQKEQISRKLTDSKPVIQNVTGHNYAIKATENGFELVKTHGDKQKPEYTKPFIISILPLAFQSAFKDLFSKTFPQHAGNSNGSVILTGSVNYDNIFYHYIEAITSTEQLPDILITSDFNSLYHRGFKRCLLNSKNFETLNIPMHSIYSHIDFAHPSQLFGMIASDALVMVVDKWKFGNRCLPREWYELLSPTLHKSVAFCGDRDFFCNTTYFHFVKNFGYAVLNQLVNNTLTRIHPEEMLHSIHLGNKIGASVYVMPYSYAMNIQDKLDYQVVWPEDGAILIPMQMLIKKGTSEKHQEVIDFITGKALGTELEKKGFIATNPETSKLHSGTKLNWIGWDFIDHCDLNKMKHKIRESFENI
jgi:hypothetical protein